MAAINRKSVVDSRQANKMIRDRVITFLTTNQPGNRQTYPFIKRMAKLANGIDPTDGKLAAYCLADHVVKCSITALGPEQQTIIQGYANGDKVAVIMDETGYYSKASFYDHQLQACLVFAENLDALANATGTSRDIIPAMIR